MTAHSPVFRTDIPPPSHMKGAHFGTLVVEAYLGYRWSLTGQRVYYWTVRCFDCGDVRARRHTSLEHARCRCQNARKKHTCRTCGQVGHNARSCSQLSPEREVAQLRDRLAADGARLAVIGGYADAVMHLVRAHEALATRELDDTGDQ